MSRCLLTILGAEEAHCIMLPASLSRQHGALDISTGAEGLQCSALDFCVCRYIYDNEQSWQKPKYYT